MLVGGIVTDVCNELRGYIAPKKKQWFVWAQMSPEISDQLFQKVISTVDELNRPRCDVAGMMGTNCKGVTIPK